MKDKTILSSLIFMREEGALLFKDVRYLLIRPETLASVHKALEDKMGPEQAGEILYAGGFTGGQLSGRKYKETFGMSARETAEFMCQMGGELGWGNCCMVEFNHDIHRMVVEVHHSPFAISYRAAFTIRRGEGELGVCHLIRGVLGGLCNGLFNVPIEARETKCLVLGDDCCRFEITENKE